MLAQGMSGDDSVLFIHHHRPHLSLVLNAKSRVTFRRALEELELRHGSERVHAHETSLREAWAREASTDASIPTGDPEHTKSMPRAVRWIAETASTIVERDPGIRRRESSSTVTPRGDRWSVDASSTTHVRRDRERRGAECGCVVT
jgi:hypothetical protein